ncbi:MAG: SusC/RagA family TonB-linked outer membrane protein [Saprospiraceae bacterium]|nr:SusC/RagA family TonB-linked outer membrane protein [Saprospiraceae bacterium]
MKGTSLGTVTDSEGKYSVQVPKGYEVLVYSYTGYTSQEIKLGVQNVVNVKLEGGVTLSETVVTAYGISKYKNEVAFSAQKVTGDELTRTRDANVVNSLSGKVAGLNIKRTNTLGGSTNIVLRGNKSLTGDNQALFVIDGVPVDNSNTNSSNQRTGRGGYDYGNAAADINADDIESMTVLKGPAASALYGSRAANGVVMITTKKGTKKNGIGVSVNTGFNVGRYDKSTFLKYQKKYGAGYGTYYEDESGFFLSRDINGDGTDDLVTPTSEDASWGAKFDPALNVYQWDAFDPGNPNYGKATPWVAAQNDPNSFFEDAFGTNNGVSIDAGLNGKGYFKLGYNYITDKGILPNSNINKNLINFGAGYDIAKNLRASAAINYTSIKGKGRYGTGYDPKNLMTNFRQWWQTNVDILAQKDAYERENKNVTWNWADPTDLVPIYWDNPYFTRYQNYQNDGRSRYFGNMALDYKILSWLNLRGQVSLDKYYETQEERIAVGSIDPSEYGRFNRNYEEYNYDLLASTTQMKLTEKLKFNALLGSNVRKQNVYTSSQKTNGGLAVPGIYAIGNSVNSPLAPVESYSQLQVNGIFGQAGFVYDDFLILDVTGRRDKSSSLPVSNNTFFYPSASLGFIFSKFIPENKAISFGKIRLNYAEVGNSAPPLRVYDYYTLGVATLNDRTVYSTSIDGASQAANPFVKNNPNLKPERTKSTELGLEMRFLESRLGFDLNLYKMNSIDQIVSAPVSRATGYSSIIFNAGEIENKGVELQVFFRPFVKKDFDWKIDLNWSKNVNKVVSLGGDIDNLQLASFQGGVSINAALDQAYGEIRGSNFVYHDGQKVINGATGLYKTSATSDEVIGNVNPDWIAGMNNTFTYKFATLSFLIDVKHGGDVFSLDRYYGLATGLAEETALTNELGNEVRSPLVTNADGTYASTSGGVLLNGVVLQADGSYAANIKRASAVNFGIYGYRRNPAAAFVYDASYVKLRELNLSFNLPTKWLGDGGAIKGASLGIYGRNLWIISKNLPDADPEDGISSGNVQGYQGGSYPTTKVYGVNLNIKF